jgi:hypothetical protein
MARPDVTGKRKATAKNVAEPVEFACFSIKSFCAAHHLSEAMYFKMKAAGWGPKEALVGSRVLITHEAAARWRAEREAAAANASTSK